MSKGTRFMGLEGRNPLAAVGTGKQQEGGADEPPGSPHAPMSAQLKTAKIHSATYSSLAETPVSTPCNKGRTRTFSTGNTSFTCPSPLCESVTTPHSRMHQPTQFLKTLSSLAAETEARVHSHISSKRTSSQGMDDELERLRQEAAAKSKEIRELKRRLELLEAHKSKPEESHFEKLLDIRNREIALLKEELKSTTRKNANSAELEMKKISEMYQTSELSLAATKAKLDETLKKLKDMEERQGAGSTLYQIIECFQKENKTLKEEMRKMQAQLISQEHYYALERQLREVEDMQNHLIAENRSMKSDLQEREAAAKIREKRLMEMASGVADRRKELTQLSEIIRIVSHGEGISAALILGARSDQERRRSLSQDLLDSLSSELTDLKREVAGLRQLLSDVYAEQSGYICAQQ